MWYYLRDVTGEITALVNSAGEVVCHYEYDAYGNHVVLDSNNTIVTSETFIGNINPFRYKGYYFDSETSLYYCMSRYYNPEWCRWISPDDVRYLSFDYVEGLNLYCYCLNNPVYYVDDDGATPVAISQLYNFMDVSIKSYILLLKKTTNIKPKKVSFDLAKKLARKEGHKQSARAIQKAISKNSDDIIRSTTKTLNKLNRFIKCAGVVFYGVDVLWTGIENYQSGDEDWLPDTVLYALVNGALLLLPGGFFVSLATSIVLPVLESRFDSEIENIKDSFADLWDYIWSFDW